MFTIDVYSDVICPWCFIGKRRMERGLAGLAATVRRHPFELNPDMPREGVERRAYRVKKFGIKWSSRPVGGVRAQPTFDW